MRLSRLLTHCGLGLASLGLVSCDRTQLAVEPGVSLELAQYRAAVISDINYRLHLSIPAEQESDIPGRITIDFRLADTSQPLQLDFREDERRVDSVLVNGDESRYLFQSEHLVIPSRELNEGDNRVEIGFLAGSSSLNRNPGFLYTLFVPDRARTAFPLFDQPDLKATWELSLDIPAGWTALSGAPVEQIESDGVRDSIRFSRSDLFSSYLFSFVVGDFQTITRDVGGRPMSLLHRETDAARVERNLDEIFRLHAEAIAWLEDYTGIAYPFEKFDVALLPAHPYGGMEHVGAIQYKAESLWLDEAPSDTELLNRASLIAHETAHMWFGNLVTMRWFNDVWTKEVFANFMAAKIVNPAFPAIDHDLNFLVSHHPGAYAVDRTAGANPIRQFLPNLNQAGQMYGAIIYDKAPIMMRQLELLLGEDAFRAGMREYLKQFAYANATWPDLIRILDELSEEDIASWSQVWVNSPGRPWFALAQADDGMLIEQQDPAGQGRLWPQTFSILGLSPEGPQAERHTSRRATALLPDSLSAPGTRFVLNADGLGYGLFPADLQVLQEWADLDDLARAALLVNLYEQMLESGRPQPATYLEQLVPIVESAKNQLVLNLALGHLQRIYWTLIPASARTDIAPRLEQVLWRAMLASDEEATRKVYFNAFANIALTGEAIQRVADVWSGELEVDRLLLAERDMIRLTQILAIKRPADAQSFIEGQLARTLNPDQQRRLEFIAPSLSADPAVRDAFFASLAEAKNRETESWVIDALANLHHPLRTHSAERYVQPSLELLQEIQATGDIFFPARWLGATLSNHHSDPVVAVVSSFLAERPAYNPQLKMKIQQASDPVLRANRLRQRGGEASRSP